MPDSKYVKKMVNTCLDADIVGFIWSGHGLGKSSIVRQVCVDRFGECNEGKGGNFIDLRLGNLEVGDLIGLPIEAQLAKAEKTIFAIPEFWPEDGEGIIFLDELNRAQQVVLQACFSLILDRRIHRYTLPKGWQMVAAGNPSGEDYIVNEIDQALFSRFCHITYEPTRNDWMDYAKESGLFRDDIITFVDEKGENMLFGKQDKTEETIKVEPNPRAYEMLSRAMNTFNYEDDLTLLRYVAFGLIGKDAGTAFATHIRESDRPLKGDQIIDDYAKHRKKVKKWVNSAQIHMALISQTASNLVDEIVKRVETDEKHDYFTSTIERMDTKKAGRSHRGNYSIVEDKESKKNVALFSPMLNNVVDFLVDIPDDLTVTVIKRDIHVKEATGTKNDGVVRRELIAMIKYFFNHKKLAKMLADSGKQIS